MTVYLETPQATILHGDVRTVLRADDSGYDFELGYGTARLIADESVDAVVTDPPYELGFMGKSWDASGIAYDVAVWREAYRALKPGGHLLAFGGSRTWHRLAVAIEDAGFEIRDSIAWLYASGFPKSLDVATAIDKLDAAEERRTRALTFTAWMREHLTAQQINEITGTLMGSHYVTDKEQPAVATPELFDILRPHLPPVPVAIEELVAEREVESENWRSRTVTGQHEKPAPGQMWRANVLGGEIKAARERRDRAFTEEARAWEGWGTALKPAFEPIVVARKPLSGTVAANVVALGTGALNIDATRVPMSDVDAAAINSKHAGMDAETYERRPGASLNLSTNPMPLKPAEAHERGRWPTNVVMTHVPLLSEVGESVGDACAGGCVEGCAVRALDEQESEVSRYFPVFRFEAKAPASERPRVNGIAHPTVKPLALMRWLCRLVTPPGGRVLELYAGSGTTVEAALAEGFTVTAIEREADYLPLIGSRLEKGIQPVMDIWGGEAA